MAKFPRQSRWRRIDPHMENHARIQLSRLREIGWTMWDPIGLSDKSSASPEGCADEYDAYLLQVVSMLRRGLSREEAVAYLLAVSSDQMGFSQAEPDRAAATVSAIADNLHSVSDGPRAIR